MFPSLRSTVFPYSTLFRSYYDFVGGIPGGRQRQANLRALYDRARGYESTSFRGLFRILEPCHKVLLNRSEEHTSELQSRVDLVCRLQLESRTRTECSRCIS